MLYAINIYFALCCCVCDAVTSVRLDATVSNASKKKSRDYGEILRDSGDSVDTDLDDLATLRHMTG